MRAVPAYVYVIEIAPKWIGKVASGNKKRTERLLYVGATSKANVRDRFAQHMRGERVPESKSGPGKVFKEIRRERVGLGLPGELVDGEDAWLLEEFTEELPDMDAAREREGELANAFIRDHPGVWAHSNETAWGTT